MGRICRSWLHREQSEDRLLSVHPRSSHLAAPRDHVMNPLIVVGDVAHEDGHVMRDPGPDRKRVVTGKMVSVRVDLGGRRTNKKTTSLIHKSLNTIRQLQLRNTHTK